MFRLPPITGGDDRIPNTPYLIVNAELRAIAQRKQRKATPPPAAAAPVQLDAAAKVAFDERPTPPPLPDKPKKEPRTIKPSGRKPLPAHLPVENHALRPDHCERCGGTTLDVVDEVVEEKLHVVKEHQRRRVVKRTTCRCRACGTRTTPASLPAPYERSKVTCDWLAWFIHQKFGLLAPLDRIRRDLAERGIPLAMGSLVNFVERAADADADGTCRRRRRTTSSPAAALAAVSLQKLIAVRAEALEGDQSLGDMGIVVDGLEGHDTWTNDVALQSDGKIVVAGAISGEDGVAVLVARYTVDGARDTTFGMSGFRDHASCAIRAGCVPRNFACGPHRPRLGRTCRRRGAYCRLAGDTSCDSASVDERTWRTRHFSELTTSELYDVLALRQRVFVVEQNCPYLDADGLDQVSRHLWAAAPDGTVHAYARIVPAGSKFDEVSIGRVITAPEARGTGLGRELMRRAIAACGDVAIRIGAQAHLEKFYGELGFVRASDVYEEDGIPHIEMLRGI